LKVWAIIEWLNWKDWKFERKLSDWIENNECLNENWMIRIQHKCLYNVKSFILFLFQEISGADFNWSGGSSLRVLHNIQNAFKCCKH
jgi:hypothetical protein